jgi:hypothetical protein
VCPPSVGRAAEKFRLLHPTFLMILQYFHFAQLSERTRGEPQARRVRLQSTRLQITVVAYQYNYSLYNHTCMQKRFINRTRNSYHRSTRPLKHLGSTRSALRAAAHSSWCDAKQHAGVCMSAWSASFAGPQDAPDVRCPSRWWKLSCNAHASV